MAFGFQITEAPIQEACTTGEAWLLVCEKHILTHSFPMHPSSTPWKNKKTVTFSDVFRG